MTATPALVHATRCTQIGRGVSRSRLRVIRRTLSQRGSFGLRRGGPWTAPSSVACWPGSIIPLSKAGRIDQMRALFQFVQPRSQAHNGGSPCHGRQIKQEQPFVPVRVLDGVGSPPPCLVVTRGCPALTASIRPQGAITGHMHRNRNVGRLPESGRNGAASKPPMRVLPMVAVVVSFDDDKPG
jgi:hypothetical protein